MKPVGLFVNMFAKTKLATVVLTTQIAGCQVRWARFPFVKYMHVENLLETSVLCWLTGIIFPATGC